MNRETESDREIMKYRITIIFGAIITMAFLLLFPVLSPKNSNAANAAQLRLFQALMCEEVKSGSPSNPTMVFSANKEKAVCFSIFDPVPQKTVIYHNWYHRDVPSARIQLPLEPPRWSTHSSIQLRKTDIGPWRVEITDEKGRVLEVLRFSVTD
jgi:Protein of unknown function (DUF2914)